MSRGLVKNFKQIATAVTAGVVGVLPAFSQGDAIKEADAKATNDAQSVSKTMTLEDLFFNDTRNAKHMEAMDVYNASMNELKGQVVLYYSDDFSESHVEAVHDNLTNTGFTVFLAKGLPIEPDTEPMMSGWINGQFAGMWNEHQTVRAIPVLDIEDTAKELGITPKPNGGEILAMSTP